MYAMVLQCLSNVTLICPIVNGLFGPGEFVTLPLRDAIRVMDIAAEHFKIVSPLPLLPGVLVCWSLLDDRVQGPAPVQLAEGISPNRVIAVLNEGQLVSIHEQSVIDINPWPAIDDRLEDVWLDRAIDGPDAPRVIEARDWLIAHFDEDEDW